MPVEQKKEPGEVHPKYWARTVIEAFKNDPFRIAVEIIKNAADSYTRLEKRGKAQPPFEIFAKLVCRKKRPPFIEVLDQAEGMDSQKLREALKYGTQTSMGEDTEAITSAEKGIGLKDAMMALQDNWLITIKDGLLNERRKHPDFATGIGKEDAKVTQEERKKLGISNDGTIVIGRLPEYFHERKFTTICERLQQHFLMRKLLENNKYRILAIDAKTGEKRLLEHKPPQIKEQLLEETFDIEYNAKGHKIHLLVNRSSEELPQGKPFGESGLIFFYGAYSVVDLTFCRFDRDLSFSKFFGEVKLEVERIVRDPDESPLVDEKRRGLDSEHPFNKKLFKEINQRLQLIQEREEASKYSFDESTKKDILRELNKLYKEIKGTGILQPPIEPATFAFYPVYASIREYEPRTVSLIINSSIISDRFEISLQSTNSEIIAKRPVIKFAEKPKERFVTKQVELYSEKANIKGELIAKGFPFTSESAKMGIEVMENPIFSPQNGFAFVPDKTTIVDGGDKKVPLCVDRNTVSDSREITLASSDPINCPGKWLLPQVEKLEKYIIKNIVKIEIPLKVRGTDHVGEKASIEATYEDRTANLNITVVPEPTISGLFRDIRPSAKDTKKICDFIKDEGVLEVYYKHPLFKKYMRKNFRARSDFLVFAADTITREVIKACVASGIEESSSRFYIFDLDHPEKDIETHVIHEYYEHGPMMHEMFMKLARTFKLGEE